MEKFAKNFILLVALAELFSACRFRTARTCRFLTCAASDAKKIWLVFLSFRIGLEGNLHSLLHSLMFQTPRMKLFKKGQPYNFQQSLPSWCYSFLSRTDPHNAHIGLCNEDQARKGEKFFRRRGTRSHDSRDKGIGKGAVSEHSESSQTIPATRNERAG